MYVLILSVCLSVCQQEISPIEEQFLMTCVGLIGPKPASKFCRMFPRSDSCGAAGAAGVQVCSADGCLCSVAVIR